MVEKSEPQVSTLQGIEGSGKRNHPLKEIDPVLTLSEDIAKLVVDWAHINQIDVVDEIRVVIKGTSIESGDFKELLAGLLTETPAEESKIRVEEEEVHKFCKEHHVTSEEDKCHVCGKPAIRRLPKITVEIKSDDLKAEIHI